MNKKFLFGIVFCVLLLTCCISEKEETTTTTPSSKTVKVDPKDFMLEAYEMPGNYSLDKEYYLSKNDIKDWAIERGWQGGYKRVYIEDSKTSRIVVIGCDFHTLSSIQDAFNYSKGYHGARVSESPDKKDFELVSSPEIGDGTFAYQFKGKAGEKWYTYRALSFIKQNIFVRVVGSWDVSWDDIIEMAEKIAEKIPDKEMELSEKAKSAAQTPRPTTPAPTTAAPTTAPPTTPAPTTPPPTTTPTTTPPPTTPASKHITLKGEMNEPLDDGKLYLSVWSISKSDYGGYWVEVFFENSSKDNVLWKPVEIKVIDSNGDSYDCRFYNPYSYIKSGSGDYLSGVEQILDPDEGFRLVLGFPTGMYLPKTFILTNEYSDGSTTTWEIGLKFQ
jgi:cell division septation protein DedD